jgi:hypothetical protein
MNTYNLTTIKETTIVTNSITTTEYYLPVDQNGNVVLDYLNKFRIIKNGQMLVFDNGQEYNLWLEQNS